MKYIFSILIMFCNLFIKAQNTTPYYCISTIDTIITLSTATISRVTINNIVPSITATSTRGTIINQINISQDTANATATTFYIIETDNSGANAKLVGTLYAPITPISPTASAPLYSVSTSIQIGTNSTQYPFFMNLYNGQKLEFAASFVPPGGHWYVNIKGCVL